MFHGAAEDFDGGSFRCLVVATEIRLEVTRYGVGLPEV